jgi:hypothetical protein
LPYFEVSFLISAAHVNIGVITLCRSYLLFLVTLHAHKGPHVLYLTSVNASDIRGLGLLGITALVLRGTTNAVYYLGRTRHVANKVIVRGLETMLQPDEACGYCSSIVLFLPDLRGYCYSCVRFPEKPKDASEHHQLCKTKSVHLQIIENVHFSSRVPLPWFELVILLPAALQSSKNPLLEVHFLSVEIVQGNKMSDNYCIFEANG